MEAHMKDYMFTSKFNNGYFGKNDSKNNTLLEILKSIENDIDTYIENLQKISKIDNYITLISKEQFVLKGKSQYPNVVYVINEITKRVNGFSNIKQGILNGNRELECSINSQYTLYNKLTQEQLGKSDNGIRFIFDNIFDDPNIIVKTLGSTTEPNGHIANGKILTPVVTEKKDGNGKPFVIKPSIVSLQVPQDTKIIKAVTQMDIQKDKITSKFNINNIDIFFDNIGNINIQHEIQQIIQCFNSHNSIAKNKATSILNTLSNNGHIRKIFKIVHNIDTVANTISSGIYKIINTNQNLIGLAKTSLCNEIKTYYTSIILELDVIQKEHIIMCKMSKLKKLKHRKQKKQHNQKTPKRGNHNCTGNNYKKLFVLFLVILLIIGIGNTYY